MKKALILSLVFVIVALSACASRHFSDKQPQPSKQILDITIKENPESVILTISGNQPLTYTFEQERKPEGIYFRFSETGADNVIGRFIPPANGIINSIRVDNFVEDETLLAVVFVALNQESVFEVVSDNNDILVYFTRKADVPDTLESQKEPSVKESKPEPEPDPIQETALPASELKAVTSKSIENLTTVALEADGTITDYKTFKMLNPDRIVFDLYKLKSPYRGQKTLDVQSELVHRIRYYGHPHKLRLVIDTRNNRLLKYSSESTDTGLTIQIYKSE